MGYCVVTTCTANLIFVTIYKPIAYKTFLTLFYEIAIAQYTIGKARINSLGTRV